MRWNAIASASPAILLTAYTSRRPEGSTVTGASSRRSPCARGPYTSLVEATRQRVPFAAQASSTAAVPSTLRDHVPTGSSATRRTPTAAARWKTTSARATAGATRARSRTSPRTSVTVPAGRGPCRCSAKPVERSSSATTSAPSAARRSTRWLPRKPAPPVTRTRMGREPTSGGGAAAPVELDDGPRGPAPRICGARMGSEPRLRGPRARGGFRRPCPPRESGPAPPPGAGSRGRRA